MEISHASTETQSAAVGITGKAEEVTVSTDAEFMMMIAHGIYSNKALALVRELLCNARDGHAKADCLDKPIHVTLEDNKLVIRDHGTGIPNAIFAPTYLTFGKSTKRKDKKATGGFGVGSKVPWAVCDTFSARNYIDGTMTAYSIMKSDPAMDGKPTCTPIMTIPSTEPSGVEVSVPFSEKMFHEIRDCIEKFSSELNIPIILNGMALHRDIGYNHVELKEAGFTILPHHPKTVIQRSSFYVRQGDVIYPIEAQEEFADAFDLLSHLNPDAGRNPILFMAEPDTIIPTLSRESLQYTDLTSVSIRSLMAKALKVLADNIDAMALDVAEKLPILAKNQANFVNDMWSTKFRAGNVLHESKSRFKVPDGVSASAAEMMLNSIYRWLSANTPYLETQVTNGKAFREEIQAVLETLFDKELDKYYYLNKERMLELRKFPTSHHKNNGTDTHKLMTQNMVKEVKYFYDLGIVNKDVLDTYFATSDDMEYVARTSYTTASNYITSVSEFFKAEKDTEKACSGYNYNDLRQMLYVSKTVIISSAPKTMVQRAMEFFAGKPLENRNPLQQHYGLARLKGARCIRLRAGAKDSDIHALSQHLTAAGYDVICLLTPTKSERAEAEALALERAKLKEIPLPTLGQLIYDGLPSWPSNEYKKKQKLLKHLNSNPNFVGKAMYFIIGKGKELPSGVSYLDDYRKLVKMVGTDIICVSTKPEIAKVIKDGRVNVEEVLIEFAEYFLRRKDIRRKLFYRNSFLAKRKRQNKYLTKYLFGVDVPQMTDEERQIYESIMSYTRTFPELYRRILKRTKLLLKSDRVSRKFARLFERYGRENFCDVDRALEAAYARKPSKTRTLAREILRKIVKESNI